MDTLGTAASLIGAADRTENDNSPHAIAARYVGPFAPRKPDPAAGRPTPIRPNAISGDWIERDDRQPVQ
jgi:hypothetical protein